MSICRMKISDIDGKHCNRTEFYIQVYVQWMEENKMNRENFATEFSYLQFLMAYRIKKNVASSSKV